MTVEIITENKTTTDGREFASTVIRWDGHEAIANDRGVVVWSDAWGSIRDLVDEGVLRLVYGMRRGPGDFVLAA